jgi:hypothetical protein
MSRTILKNSRFRGACGSLMACKKAASSAQLPRISQSFGRMASEIVPDVLPTGRQA